jgi:hypothetical protein
MASDFDFEFDTQFLEDHIFTDSIQNSEMITPANNLLPEKPEGHVIDFILLNEDASQPSTPLLTQVYPPERLAHSDPSFYKRVIDQASERIQKMQPYATLLASGIKYRLECAHVSYLVEPTTSIPVERPTPYFYHFQLPLTDDVIPNMPYPATFPSSRGPQTRIKISLKFLLSTDTNTNTNTVSDIFDQFPSIPRLIDNIVREHLAKDPGSLPASPTFQPTPSTSTSSRPTYPMHYHHHHQSQWKKRGKRRM